MNQDIKNLVFDFFSNLKCNPVWNDEVLFIEKISKDFENFYGKKAPYSFVFEKAGKGDEELIVKGSPLLKAMAGYLESRGQTTLLKINYNVEAENINKFVQFKNCKITSLSKEPEYHFIYRFTFQTNFQYLNDKEQIISSVYLNDGKVVKFDVEKYPIIEGKKNEIVIGDIKESYNTAKEHLKIVLDEKIKSIGEYLDKKLDKEVTRIKEHYKNQFEELDQMLVKGNAQLLELEKHGKSEEIDKKIEKIKENLLKARNAELREKLRKEEEFFITDETHKHGLNISNSLINTTIIYYPIFNIGLWVKNESAQRRIDLVYNPFLLQVQSVSCDVCKKELAEIFLCTGGHVACSDCLGRCGMCGNDYCGSCLARSCAYCNKKLCMKCSSKCLKCGNFFCQNHIKGDSATRTLACVNCMKKCGVCGGYAESLGKCPNCGREMCKTCLKEDVSMVEGKSLCPACSKNCPTCGKIRSLESFRRCSFCSSESCNYSGKCLICRKQLCSKLRARLKNA